MEKICPTVQRWLKQFQETVVFCTEKEQEDVDRIQEAWTTYVPRKARILKLFSIWQFLLCK
jgi:hypothetical protein